MGIFRSDRIGDNGEAVLGVVYLQLTRPFILRQRERDVCSSERVEPVRLRCLTKPSSIRQHRVSRDHRSPKMSRIVSEQASE